MTKTTSVLVLAIASVLFTSVISFPPVHADIQVDIDFESLTTGNSVEGLGTIHPDLDIQSPTNGGVVIEEDVLGSYTVPSPTRSAGCLDDGDNDGDARGMGNTAGSAPWTTSNAARANFDFTFNGKTVNSFSIESYDFGDFRPAGSNPMILTVTGFNDANNAVDSETFTVDRNSIYDACKANGIKSFDLSGSGIVRVEIRNTGGLDPGVGFDNLSFTLEHDEVEIDIKPGSNPSSVSCKNLKGTVPVAIFTTDSFNAADIDLDSLMLEGTPVTEKHNSVHLEDIDDDGDADAVLHLDKNGVCAATSGLDKKVTEFVTLSGSTSSGTFEGLGDIRIVN